MGRPESERVDETLRSPRRGDIWTTDTGISVLVISSTVYNEIASEPTVIVVPIFDHDLDTGFGVELGDAKWAAPGLVTSLRKSALDEFHREADIQSLTDVNNMLFKILATPDR
ncbi:type II toxin-antitoxin system PemK/MazF family toxin [Mycobacterium malmoense]|uniref:type II toxin-antitoxin system PemK/MazF family toxin n=1 Tax=Mycobacterium malmoense TaxID=1780 RepID=UPI0008F88590|nr:type II toxin-antitoxin system PemK/MazF family toxin [Mycobacterium malmoense]OIN81364.1 MazF family transcriptional regulator [Mycobacterium malmoense]